MTQQTTPPEGDAAVTDASVNAVPPELRELIDMIAKDPAKTALEIKNLRAEAKQKREAATDAERKRQAEEAARLEADAKWQEAAQAYKKQLDELTPKAQRADEAYNFLQEMASRRIAALPKHFQSLVDPNDPIKALTWLEANAAVVSLPAPVPTDAGTQGDRSQQAVSVGKLTSDELALAKQAGMTPEQFAQYKQRRKPEGAM